MPKRTLRMVIAYDGTEFSGWQWQPGRRTVQGVLEEALEQVTTVRTRTFASGRTDAGVHALGQLVSFKTTTYLSPEVLQRALNALVPEDLVVRHLEEAAPGFNAINHVLTKRYRYVLHDGPLPDVFARRYCWKLWHRLDHQRMAQAAQVLVGTHDFASFQSKGSPRQSTVRTVVDLTVRRLPPPAEHLVFIEVEADGFLYHMVRILVGTLVAVGTGQRDVDWVHEVLQARDRKRAGITAPPQGLFMLAVRLPPQHASPPMEQVAEQVQREWVPPGLWLLQPESRSVPEPPEV